LQLEETYKKNSIPVGLTLELYGRDYYKMCQRKKLVKYEENTLVNFK